MTYRKRCSFIKEVFYMSLRSKDVVLKKVLKEWHNSCQVALCCLELLLTTCGADFCEDEKGPSRGGPGVSSTPPLPCRTNSAVASA